MLYWTLFILLLAAVIYALIVLAYYLLQERLLFNAGPRLHRLHRFRLASEHEEVFLESGDGSIVHGVLIRSPQARGLILYFHGNTGNLRRWATVAEELTTYGQDVLAVDYRGFGKSEGRRSEPILHEDAQLFYEHCKSLCPEEKLTIYGRSLGTGLAVPLAANNRPKQLILETPFYHLIEVAFHHAPFIPVRWVLKYPFRSDKFIQKVECPVSIFHGTKDLIVPYKSGLRLYEKIKDDPKHQMVTIPRGRHSNLNGFPLFRDKLKALLSK